MNVIVSHGHLNHFRLRLPRLEILVGILAAAVVLDLGLVYLSQPGEPLATKLDHVTSVTWASNGTALSSASGFTARPGTHMVLILQDTNCLLGCVPINFTAVSLMPAEFTLVSVSLPVIPPGSSGNLTVAVEIPSHPYSGPLTVNLS